MGQQHGAFRGRWKAISRAGLIAAAAGLCQRAVMLGRSHIQQAAVRIAPYIRHTPVLRLAPGELGQRCAIVLKLEMVQHAGSFKPRGAFNRILASAVPAAGVIAASGGNHGAAVAHAARQLGLSAEIFVPEIADPAKCARIAGLGARLVRVGATYAEALAAAQARQGETGALDVHAYDHVDVLAGQGTVGVEFEADAPDVTHLLVAVGGGGLIGGIAAWFGGGSSRPALVAVEPLRCPTLHDALREGRPVPAPVGGVAADSLGAREVGGLMFPLAQAHVTGSVLVTDDAIVAAQRLLWDRVRLVTEPGGATALAALLSGAFVPPDNACVGIVLCGANTDPGKVH